MLVYEKGEQERTKINYQNKFGLGGDIHLLKKAPRSKIRSGKPFMQNTSIDVELDVWLGMNLICRNYSSVNKKEAV